MTGWIYTILWRSKFSPTLCLRTAKQTVPKFSAFPATLLLLRDIASCFTRRCALVCGVSLAAGASHGGRGNVCYFQETPSLANACGYSKEFSSYMSTVERQLQQQPDLVDPLSCPHASNALTHKVRKDSLSQKTYPSLLHISEVRHQKWIWIKHLS